MKKLSFKSIKKINAGDVVEVTLKDAKFFEGLFSRANELCRAAEVFMRMHNEAFDEAWESFYKVYPVFRGCQMFFNPKNRTISIAASPKPERRT